MAEKEKDKLVLGPYRVLDLTDDSGALCPRILASLGADVIKIEPPAGDPTRNIGPFYHDEAEPEKSLHWFTYNLNKRSITLNLETATGQELFRKLVKTADILVESFRPGYLNKLGIGYAKLHKINPRLVHTSITPFGSRGPYAGFESSALVCLAMSGFLNTIGDPDRPPVQVASPVAYTQGGMEAAAATMIAFWYQQQTGKGQHVDVSIRDSIMAQFVNPGFVWKIRGVMPSRGIGGPQVPGMAPNRAVAKCKDGYVLCHVTHVTSRQPLRQWLADAGMAGDLMDPKWDQPFMKGGKFPEALKAHVDELFAAFAATRTKEELMHEAQKRGAQVAREQTVADVVNDPHVKAREYFVQVEHPELNDTITYGGASFKLDGMPKQWRRAPFIGEHNQEIYGEELGLNQNELTILKESGVI